MNKIFLTSGVVLCLACPAMAATDITTDGHAWGSTTTEANCTYTYLDSYDGPVNFEAKWEAIVSGAIALDSTRYTSSDAATGTAATTTATQTPIYVQFATAVHSATPISDANKITALTRTPEQRGYTFEGFYTGKAGTGTKVINSSGTYLDAALTVIDTQDQTATWYANYTANTYDVVYNACSSHASGTGTATYTATGVATYDVNYTPLGYAATGLKAVDAGYHFKEWKGDKLPNGTAATSETGFYQAGNAYLYQIPGTLNLTGVCEANQTTVNYTCGSEPASALTHTISGSAPDSATATFASSFTFATLGANQCSLTGHTASWVCTGASGTTGLGANSDASSGTYSQGQVINSWAYTGEHKGVLSCVATWSPNTYHIIYQKGTAGSRVPAQSQMANTDATFGGSVTLTSNAYSVPGYTFAGWKGDYNNANGNATAYTPGHNTEVGTDYANGATLNPYRIAHDLTLVATWTADSYTITYNCGAPITGSQSTATGPTGLTTANTNVTMDGTYTLPAGTVCTLPGYTFKGWDCEHLGTGTIQDGNVLLFAGGATGTYEYPDNITCTAKWTRNNITLHWYNDTEALNGTEIELPENSEAGSCTYDGGLTLPANPSKNGYTFQGWHARPQSNN